MGEGRVGVPLFLPPLYPLPDEGTLSRQVRGNYYLTPLLRILDGRTGDAVGTLRTVLYCDLFASAKRSI